MSSYFKKVVLGTLCVGLFTLSANAATEGTGNFYDVPSTHWAFPYVNRAAHEGWVTGVTKLTYEPDRSVSYAEIAVMMSQKFCPEEIPEQTSSPWWFLYCATCLQQGYLDGSQLGETTWTEQFVNSPCTRYDLAQIVYNGLIKHELAPTTDGTLQYSIKDWDEIPEQYQTAVETTYTAGVLTGMTDGCFHGEQTLTRAQAAVVLCAIEDQMNTISQ